MNGAWKEALKQVPGIALNVVVVWLFLQFLTSIHQPTVAVLQNVAENLAKLEVTEAAQTEVLRALQESQHREKK